MPEYVRNATEKFEYSNEIFIRTYFVFMRIVWDRLTRRRHIIGLTDSCN